MSQNLQRIQTLFGFPNLNQSLAQSFAEFLILHAPDVAISEAAVGAALAPLILIVTLKKIGKGGNK